MPLTPHRRRSSSPTEGGKQDPVDNTEWPIVVLSDHDPPVSDAVGCTDPKDLALEPDRLLPDITSAQWAAILLGPRTSSPNGDG